MPTNTRKMRLLFLLSACAACALSTTDFVKEVNQNYNHRINNQLNQQINLELQASYFYKVYASYFARADVALKGFQKFFEGMSKEENDHAQTLIDYVNSRGGSLQYGHLQLLRSCNKIRDEIKKSKDKVVTGGSLSEGYLPKNERTHPCICYYMSQKRDDMQSDTYCSNTEHTEWSNGLVAMEDALVIERYVNEQLISLHASADSHGDSHLTHVLEHAFLEEQVSSIKEFADHITQLSKFSKDYSLGEYLFDQKLQ